MNQGGHPPCANSAKVLGNEKKGRRVLLVEREQRKKEGRKGVSECLTD